MATFVELQNQVLEHSFSDAKYRPSTRIWLNEAQRYICLQADLRTQFETISFSTTAYNNTMPTDFARLIEVSLSSDATDWQRLFPIELRDFDEAPVSYGDPTYYVIAGTTLYLYPYPQGSVDLTLNYWKLPADMSSDTDEPEIPEHYQHLLVRYALKRAFERENDYEASAYFEDQFQKDLMKLRGEAQHDTADGPTQVPGGWQDVGPPTFTLP